MAHKPLSVGKIADFDKNLVEARNLRHSYSSSLFHLHEKARSLQGEEVLISGNLQTVGGVFMHPKAPSAVVKDAQVIIKYAEIIDWDEHDYTALPYLYIVAWSPAHDQTVTAVVNEHGVSISSAH
jgi:hypothetical protein